MRSLMFNDSSVFQIKQRFKSVLLNKTRSIGYYQFLIYSSLKFSV